MNFKTKFKNRFSFLKSEDFEDFLKITSKVKFKKGEKIFKSGDTKKRVYMILKGIVRGFIIDYQGRELTTFLHQESEAFMAYEPLVLNKPTNHTFECLAPTEILSFEFQDLEDLLEKNSRVKKVKDTIIMDNLLLAIQRNESFIRESPEKRYLSFMKNHSDLLQRVSQKHIASYLGITAVSFSRLKKRIYLQQEP